jgi:flagellin
MGLGNLSGADLGPSIINQAYDNLSKSAKAIASGKKVDGPIAHSVIAQQLRSDISVNVQGVRNANDAISMVQTFDGAANSISSNLTKMSKLAMQAANGTLSDQQKSVIQEEFNELAAEVNRVAGNTQFNGNNLIGVAGTEINIALGTGSDISIQSGDLTIDTTGMDLTTDAVGVLATLQQNIEQASSYRGYLGAQMNRLESTVEVMEISIEQAIKAESNISDADIAAEVAKSASYQVQAEMGVAVQSQMHAINKTVLQLLG